MTFIKHELKMNLKSLIIWASVVGSMIFCFMLLFPTMEKQIAEIGDVYSQMGGFSQAFGMDKINFATAIGFYGIEVGAVLSLGGAMFASIVGISMLAKEEGGHATEFIYVTPNSRNYFITQKLLSMTLIIFIFDLVCLGLGLLSFISVGEDIEWKKLLLYHLAQYLMHFEIASICFGISAFLRKNNIGLGIGVATLLYFINIFANITDKVEYLRFLTPFYYSDAAEIFSLDKLHGEYIAVGMIITVAAIAVAYVKYNKKDLSI